MKIFLKIFFVVITLYSLINPVFASLPSPIPLDNNLQPYSAMIGGTPGGGWALLQLNQDGTIKVTVQGTTSMAVDIPIWMAQPNWNSQELNITIPTYGTWTGTGTVSQIEGYDTCLEGIVIIRNETALSDSFSFNFYCNDKFVMAGAMAPAGVQTTFRPLLSFKFNNYQINITNKAPDTQILKIGIITSYRKK